MSPMKTSFDRDGSQIRWYDLPGAGPARVFVHGLGGVGWAAFGHIACHQALRGHRSLIIDLPGHGLSDRPHDWGYSLDDHAAAVATVCSAAGVEGIDLVGHSLGADIAITVAGRNRGLIRRLVVAEPNLDPLPRSATGARGSQRIAAQTEDGFVTAGFAACLDSDPEWASTLRCATRRRSSQRRRAGDRDAADYARHADCPHDRGTFIRGDHGEPLVDAEGLAAAGVATVTIADSGHVMMDDQPAAFVEALAAAPPDTP